jgi:hypothetical protein
MARGDARNRDRHAAAHGKVVAVAIDQLHQRSPDRAEAGKAETQNIWH